MIVITISKKQRIPIKAHDPADSAASFVQRLKQTHGKLKATVGLSPGLVSRVFGELQSPKPHSRVHEST